MQPPARLRPPVTTAYRLLSVKQAAASGTREDLDPRRRSSRGSLTDRGLRTSPPDKWRATRHLPPARLNDGLEPLCQKSRRVANESLRDKSSRLTPIRYLSSGSILCI